jgi:integrase/recombinase XerD
MLTHYFSDPVMLDLIQQTPAAAYLDCLSAELVATGYKRTTIQRYLRAAAHVSYWQHHRGRSLTELGSVCIEEFKRHLPGCQCKEFRRVNDYDVRGARKFLQYFQQTAVVSAEHRPDPSTHHHAAAASWSFAIGCDSIKARTRRLWRPIGAPLWMP